MDNNLLDKALEGIVLTEDEKKLIKWILGWDRSVVERFANIIKKCRESKI